MIIEKVYEVALREPITVIEESRVEYVKHGKTVVEETKASQLAPVYHPVFTEEAVATLGEPITVVEESRVEKVNQVKVTVEETKAA